MSDIVQRIDRSASIESLDRGARNDAIDRKVEEAVAHGADPCDAWEEAAFSPASPKVQQYEREARLALAFTKLLPEMFPDGRFNTEDLSADAMRSFVRGELDHKVLEYRAEYGGEGQVKRELIFHLLRHSGELAARIDFDWSDSSSIRESSKDEVEWGASGAVAETVQPGSFAMKRDLIERCLSPLLSLGFDIGVSAGDERRMAIYRRILSRAGFEEDERRSNPLHTFFRSQK